MVISAATFPALCLGTSCGPVERPMHSGAFPSSPLTYKPATPNSLSPFTASPKLEPFITLQVPHPAGTCKNESHPTPFWKVILNAPATQSSRPGTSLLSWLLSLSAPMFSQSPEPPWNHAPVWHWHWLFHRSWPKAFIKLQMPPKLISCHQFLPIAVHPPICCQSYHPQKLKLLMLFLCIKTSLGSLLSTGRNPNSLTWHTGTFACFQTKFLVSALVTPFYATATLNNFLLPLLLHRLFVLLCPHPLPLAKTISYSYFKTLFNLF